MERLKCIFHLKIRFEAKPYSQHIHTKRVRERVREHRKWTISLWLFAIRSGKNSFLLFFIVDIHESGGSLVGWTGYSEFMEYSIQIYYIMIRDYNGSYNVMIYKQTVSTERFCIIHLYSPFPSFTCFITWIATKSQMEMNAKRKPFYWETFELCNRTNISWLLLETAAPIRKRYLGGKMMHAFISSFQYSVIKSSNHTLNW